MDLHLTTKQFRRLLDMAYIGNWVLNSARGEDRFRAEELARRDMDDAAIDESNFAELTRRMDAYMAEFEAHGTDHVQVESDLI